MSQRELGFVEGVSRFRPAPSRDLAHWRMLGVNQGETTVTNQTAIDALALQNQRFTDMLRSADGGIWWASDGAADLHAEKMSVQATVIATALDEVAGLIKKIGA